MNLRNRLSKLLNTVMPATDGLDICREKAFEIVSDPWASEADWMRALEIIPKVRRPEKRLKPFVWRHAIVLTSIYTIAFSQFALLAPIFMPWLHHYTIIDIALLASGWAIVEALTGFATLFAMFLLLHMVVTSTFSFVDPTWLILSTNLLIYVQCRRLPMFIYGLRKLLKVGRNHIFNLPP